MSTKSNTKKVETQTEGRGAAYKNLTSLTNPDTGKSRYRTNSLVNRGGAKSIYSSFDKSSGRNIAMGMLSDFEASDEVKERFIYEARITANLEHPNIVPVHEIGYDKSDNPYFTMKLIGGETLGQIINELSSENKEYEIKYPLGYLLDIFNQAANAVEFAHSKGIIHLDIKPENLQVGSYGEVLVLDWGLAKYIGQEDENPIHFDDEYRQTHHIDQNFLDHLSSVKYENIDATMDGSVKGSPGYMAPEQASGENSKRDKRTDVYALGAMLYSILTLAKPFKGDTVSDIIENNIRGELVRPQKRTPDRNIPSALEAITVKAMQKNPDERYQSVHELVQDIMAYKHGFATSAENAGLFTQLILLMKRHKIEFFSSVAVLVILITSFAVSYDSIQKQKNVAETNLRKLVEEIKVREKAELEKKIAELEKVKAEEEKFEAEMLAAKEMKARIMIAAQKQKADAANKKLTLQKATAEKKVGVAEKKAKEASTRAAQQIKKAEEVVKKAATDVQTITAQKAKVEQEVRIVVEEKKKVEEAVKQLAGQKAKAEETIRSVVEEKKKVEATVKQLVGQKAKVEQKVRTVVEEKKKVEATVKQLAGQKAKAEAVAKTATEDKNKAVEAVKRLSKEKEQAVKLIESEKKKISKLSREKEHVEKIAEIQIKKAASLTKEKQEATKKVSILAREKQAISKLAAKEFYNKAELLWENYEFDKARFYVDLATEYDKNLHKAFALKGKLLLKELKFNEAAAAFQLGKRDKVSSVLNSFKQQTQNLTEVSDHILLELCHKIHKTGDTKTTNLLLKQLFKNYKKLSSDDKQRSIQLLSQAVRNEFRLLNLSSVPPEVKIYSDHNGLRAIISGYVSDLSPLQGLNIKELDLNTSSQLADLKFFRHLPLKKLVINIYNPGPENLNDLSGLKLTELHFYSQTPLNNVSALVGMPLEELTLRHTGLRNLNFVSKMPLVHLSFRSTMPLDIGGLKSLKLRSLHLHDCKIGNINALKGMSLRELDISNTDVVRLEPIRGQKLKVLRINNTNVDSIKALENMPLERLDMMETNVKDISPLRGMPLQLLNMADCNNISDLSPLTECKQLHSVSVPYYLNNYDFIKSLNIKYIDVEEISGDSQTVERFKDLMGD